jgi:hypothetical protein
MRANKFVFVVCGATEHINTINFSLRYLKHFSGNEIIVVTDSCRNEKSIEHDNIVDIKTPQHFNHHQASIFLKTSLNRILPQGNLYCYLDTDVLAVTDKVDSIFDHYSAPISFGADHCALDEFSPVAVRCTCEAEYNERTILFQHAIIECERHRVESDHILKQIETLVEASKKDQVGYLWERFKYNLPGPFYHLDKTHKLHKKTEVWYRSGKPVDGAVVGCIEKRCGLIWEPATEQWFTKDGRNAHELKCTHLHQRIQEKFGVGMPVDGWQHWNGGVFMFDEQSNDFLDWWHQSTLQIFEDKYWKTRDQGTLAAAAWKFGLQEHPLIARNYNFIVDYYKRGMEYSGKLAFTIGGIHKISPDFLHIYHHFGDETWNVWNDVGQLLISETS